MGVVGLGLMGQRMLGSLERHPRLKTVAGFDSAPSALDRAAAEFGFEPAADLDTLLAREDLDLVYVATPPASHVSIGKAVFERGLPLFLEKPLAVDLAQAEELVELAESSGIPAGMNFPFAAAPGVARIEQEIRDGKGGEPSRVEVSLQFSQWPRTWHHAGPWLSGSAEGGFLREVFSHFAYLTQRLCGELEVVHSHVERGPAGTETRVLAELRAGSTPVSLVAGVGTAAPDHNLWTWFGESRSYRLEDWASFFWSAGESWRELDAEPRGARDAELQLDALLERCAGRTSTLPTLREGLGVQRVVEQLLAPHEPESCAPPGT